MKSTLRFWTAALLSAFFLAGQVAPVSAALSNPASASDVRVIKRTAALNTVNASTTRGELTRITIPGGLLGTHGQVRVTLAVSKNGTTDAVTIQTHLGSISGTTNQIGLFSFSAANVLATQELLISGNQTDQTTVLFHNSASVTPTFQGSSAIVTHTINTAADWDIIIAATTLATNTVTAVYMTATVTNPDL